jgi:hypothetical protein
MDFVGFYRKLTTSRLKVTGQCEIGDKAIIAGTGKTFYVDSGATNAADTNNGRSWSAPCATVDGAINKCTANQGDVILVAEGHAETWTTTGAKLIADVVGITIIGLGTGSNRPTFTFGHTGTTWTISAANVTLCNLLLVTNVDQVVTYGTISGTDCTLVDIETRDVTDKEVVSDFTVTGDRFKVQRYFKNGYVDGDANARIFNLTGVDNALFEDCIFMTKVTTGIVNFTGTACTNVVAKKCVFYVKSTTTGAKNIVDTVTGSTYVSFECTDLSSGAITTGNISTVTDALYGTTGIASFPAGAAAANNVSIAEALRYAQENIINGGTILPATQSVYDLIAGANGIATFPASAAPSNNVSLAEVVRDIWDSLRNGTGGSEPGTNLSIVDELKKGSVDIANPRYITLPIDMTSATWNTVAAHEVLTVTGLVRLRLWIECTSTLTDAGNGATIQLGTEGATTAFIGASDTDNIVTGSVWADNTPGDTSGAFSSLVLDKVVNGLDVGYEIAVEAVTGGAITLHCVWEPMNATGAVVVGAGGVL